jgi:hypothetical protein
LREAPESPARQRRLLEGIALLLLACSAILFQRSATAPWISSVASDGARYTVSPIGVVEHRAGVTTECRWWPKLGNEHLCALNDAGGVAHMTWLRRAYPLTVVALWASVLALFLNALRIPRQAPALQLIAAAAPSVLGAVALWSIWSRAGRAIAVLEGLPPSPVMGGYGIAVAATVFSTVAAVLLLASRR